jgi:nicotinate phosphoribosyltransferase
VAILKHGVDDWSAVTVHALYEGDRIEPWDTVMTIEGSYDDFAHLEALYLGSLVRRTRIVTSVRRLVEAARPKQLLFFPARSDHWSLQPGDGYAANVGGASAVTTDAQGSVWGGAGIGTMLPHGLIAAFGGDTARAALAFAEHVGNDVPVVALVDYENDSVRTSLAVARALEGRLWGVRLDTSEHLVDRSILPQMGAFRPTGVNAQLVWNVRNALDAEGFGDVKIVVSGGFTLERIRAFEEEGVPVDAYGVGAACLEGTVDFTADIVQVDGTAQAKAGRGRKENPRMEKVR